MEESDGDGCLSDSERTDLVMLRSIVTMRIV